MEIHLLYNVDIVIVLLLHGFNLNSSFFFCAEDLPFEDHFILYVLGFCQIYVCASDAHNVY